MQHEAGRLVKMRLLRWRVVVGAQRDAARVGREVSQVDMDVEASSRSFEFF